MRAASSGGIDDGGPHWAVGGGGGAMHARARARVQFSGMLWTGADPSTTWRVHRSSAGLPRRCLLLCWAAPSMTSAPQATSFGQEPERHGGSAVVPSCWLLGLLAGGACQRPGVRAQSVGQPAAAPMLIAAAATVSMATTRGVGDEATSVRGTAAAPSCRVHGCSGCWQAAPVSGPA